MNKSFWLFTRPCCWECNSYLGSFFLIAHSRAITHATNCLLSLHKPCLFILYFWNVPNHQRSVRVSQVRARSLMKWRNKCYPPAPPALCPCSARSNLTKGFLLASSGSSPLRREFLQKGSCEQSQHFTLAALGQKTNWFKAQLEQGWSTPLSLQAELAGRRGQGRQGKAPGRTKRFAAWGHNHLWICPGRHTGTKKCFFSAQHYLKLPEARSQNKDFRKWGIWATRVFCVSTQRMPSWQLMQK